MTKEEYQDFILRYKGCGACFPLYEKLARFEKIWFAAIQKNVTSLEQEKCELLGIIQGKDKAIKELEEENDKLKKENAELKKHNEELIALINAERERQEKCNNIHLRTIAELEEENDSFKETIRKGTSCGDWNDDVHTCQMYLRQEQLQECINQLTKARRLIQKMKCCGNCKYNSYWGNEMHCNYGLKEALQEDKLVECKNMNKWEVKE